jgi:hypothetical protein
MERNLMPLHNRIIEIRKNSVLFKKNGRLVEVKNCTPLQRGAILYDGSKDEDLSYEEWDSLNKYAASVLATCEYINPPREPIDFNWREMYNM